MNNPRTSSGFSLIEIIIVIVILGVISALAIPAMNGLTPKYRLRAAARILAGQINEVRSNAGVTAKTYHLHYDLKENQAWIILPPGEDEDPELPIDEREVLNHLPLPKQVTMEKIILPDGTELEDEDVDIEFDPLGLQGSHIVYLRNIENHLIAVRFNSLLGEVAFSNKEIEFESYR